MHSWNEEFRCLLCSYSSKLQHHVDRHLQNDHLKNIGTAALNSMALQSDIASETDDLLNQKQRGIPIVAVFFISQLENAADVRAGLPSLKQPEIPTVNKCVT